MTLRGSATAAIKDLATRVNLEVHRRDLSHAARRVASMRVRGIDLVLDVGANRGGYVEDLRNFGYAGRVVSFEPIAEMFEQMRSNLASDRGWQGMRLALGDSDGEAQLNVSQDTVTSSLLSAAAGLVDRIPSASAARVDEVPLRRLDGLWDSLTIGARAVMIKLDVQGYEHAVLDGLGASLDHVVLVEAEMSLVNLYEGGSSVHDLLPRLHEAGFEVISVDSGFVDRSTGQVLDVDVLLGRSTATA